MASKKIAGYSSLIVFSLAMAVISAPTSNALAAQNADRSSVEPAVDSGNIQPSETSSIDSASGARAKNRILSVPKLKRKPSSTPLPTIDAFAKSNFVQGTGWPGIGAFKPSSDGSSLIDNSQNTIKLEVSEQKQITGVELQLVGASAHDFLAVEMTTDFLLEAMGLKSARIADFNVALEKARVQIFGKAKASANFTVGRFRLAVKPDSDNNLLVLDLDSIDSGLDSGTDRQATGVGPNSGRTLSKLGDWFKNVKAHPSNEDLPPAVAPPKVAPVQIPKKTDSVKDNIKELVDNWQKIKRKAVKNRDVKELANVLTGHALAMQTGGIKWLSDHHKFYENDPKSVELGTITEVIKGEKFSVVATVREASKYYDDVTKQLLRDSEDTYVVNYTVEKQGNKYYISDSSIVKYQTPQSTTKK